MSDSQVQIEFSPGGRTVFVLPGTKMLEAAGRAGCTIDTPCGGTGTCGKCRLQVTAGVCEPTAKEQQIFSDAEIAAGWRLACQTTVCAPTGAIIPPDSLFAGQQILTETTGDAHGGVAPAVHKVYVELPCVAPLDSAANLKRLEEQIGEFKIDPEMIRRFSARVQKNGFKGTVVLTDHELIDFEEGDTAEHCYGAAFDIGTTTLAASLVDLRSGESLAVASRMNPQVSFGDDVLSRIAYASDSPENLEELRQSIVTAIGEMIDELATEATISREYVYEVVFSGNTTMLHILCGIDVSPLGHFPFAPVQDRGLLLGASELGVNIHPGGRAYVFPVIGGFVGGDTVAGLLSTRACESDGPILLVDIGTNGEIALVNDGKIWAASTAAGPAFEGARISCGMRATRGAIEKVVFDDDIDLSVIGNVEPIGICGSGLVDLAAGLLDAGIVTPQGRLLPLEDLPQTLPEPLRKRVRQGEFVLGDNSDSSLTITQRDIRELQLATGAIRAGVNILLRIAALKPGDLHRILIAGGFGSFIRRSHAQRIGLLPSEIEHRKIQYVGNTSLAGARWVLLSTRARQNAERLARLSEHVQLAEDHDFQREFADAMIFPGNE